ncbi:MAG: hypothetical protein JWR09_5428 [Mucilaginibacter sp.]|nr:hypothetical protein [Mucilaginibacter sp.]
MAMCSYQLNNKMKMITLLAFTQIPIEARSNNYLVGDPTFFLRIVLTTIMLYVGVSFIQAIVRLLLDHGIKKRIIDKGLPEETAKAILSSGTKPLKEAALKWFLAFGGIAAGLCIVALIRPTEIYSLAIISACMALSFGTYYLINRKKN